MTDKHRKRPRDPSQLAKVVVDIAAGVVEDGQSAPKNHPLKEGCVYREPHPH